MKNAVIKAVAATLAIAACGTASAAKIPANGIFFSAWNGDPDAPSSIVINLNLTTDQFLTNPAAGYTLNSTDAAALGSWLGGLSGGTTGVEWGVFGAMLGPQDSTTYGPILTSPGINNPAGPNPLQDNPNWGTFQGLEANIQGFEIFLTNPNNGPFHLDASTNVYSANDTASLFWPTYGGNIGVDGLASVNSSMGFYRLFSDQEADPFFTGDGIQYGNWTLSYASGLASLVYAAAGGGPEVPIPGAVWLLGSGLLGLVSIRRRKSATAADAAA